jgi:hypothetical protein
MGCGGEVFASLREIPSAMPQIPKDFYHEEHEEHEGRKKDSYHKDTKARRL